MAKVSVGCPGCAAKLNLPDSSKLGKKIKCPKCEQIFVAESLDGGDEDADSFDEDEAPAKSVGSRKRGSRDSTGKKSGGKKSGGESGGNGAVLIGGGVAVAVVLLIAGLFFAGVFGGAKAELAPPPVAEAAPAAVPVAPAPISPAEKTLALRWMPADTELLIHVKVSDIWAAPLLKSALELPQTATVVADFQKQTGMLPTEVESVTVGVADLSGAMLRSKAPSGANGAAAPPPGFGSSGMMPPNPFGNLRPEDQRFVGVIRTKKSIDLNALMQVTGENQQKEHQGKTYFEAPLKPSQPSSGVWAPDANTLVFATMKDLLATMDRGETVTPRKEFTGIEHASHFILASIVQEPKPEDLPAGVELPMPVAMMQSGIKEYGIQTVSLGLSIKGGFDLNLAVSNSSADGSKKLKGELETQLAQAKSQFGILKGAAPPLLGELGQMLLDNIKLEEQSQQVRLATSVPDSAQAKLEQLPTLLTVMAMTGGLNPLLGGQSKGPSLGAIPSPAAANPSSGQFGQQPNPSETEPVASTSTEGLPAGYTLSARTSWNDFPIPSLDGKQSVPVQLMFDVSGDSLNTYCAFGQVSMKTMSIEGGSLKEIKNSMTFGPDPLKGMVPYDSADKLNFTHPTGAMRVRFAVDPPAAKVTKIIALEGTFKLLTFESARDFSITDAPKKALRALADPDLKAAGVKLLLNKPIGGGVESLTLSCGKAHFLGRATASGPQSAAGVTHIFMPDIDKGQPVFRLQAFDQGGKFAENTEVKFKLFRDVKEQTVSFRFENVPLPALDAKPKGP